MTAHEPLRTSDVPAGERHVAEVGTGLFEERGDVHLFGPLHPFRCHAISVNSEGRLSPHLGSSECPVAGRRARLTVVISAALAASVGGAGGSLTSLIWVTGRPTRPHGRGADINGGLRSTVAASAGREDRCLW